MLREPRDTLTTMFARLVSTAVAAGLITGCYDVPRPECGFVCGTGGECPADYSCSTDNRCHLIGSSPNLVCPSVDGGFQPDVTPPYLFQQLPEPGSTEVPTFTSIVVELSEDVLGVNATNFHVMANGMPVAGTVLYESSVAPYFARFVPNAPFDLSTTVTVNLTSGIRDLFGNRLSPVSWSFTTASDETPPQVTLQSPADGEINVATTRTIRAHFSEQVFNVNDSSFVVATEGTQVAGSLSYDGATMSATLLPDAPLWGATIYDVQLTPQIQDAHGNSLPLTFWTFETAPDAIPPMITTRSPMPGETNVGMFSSIVFEVDEPVIGVSTTTFTLTDGTTAVPATIASSAFSLGWILTPVAPLAAGTTYTVTVTGGVTDRSTNPITGAPVTWTFTTAR